MMGYQDLGAQPMNNRKNLLPAVTATLSLLLAGCSSMTGGEATSQAAPVPPPPGYTAASAPHETPKTKTQKEDLPDRLFAPLDNTVNDINRDINREIDKEFPPDKSD
jgi:hypothetical protein